jgi:arsenite methyltransferase
MAALRESISGAASTSPATTRRVRPKTPVPAHLPFPDASFDVVTSALAVHNIPTADGRGRAVAEMARVLKPGGRLVLADIKHVNDYAAALADVMSDLEYRFLWHQLLVRSPVGGRQAVTSHRR